MRRIQREAGGSGSSFVADGREITFVSTIQPAGGSVTGQAQADVLVEIRLFERRREQEVRERGVGLGPQALVMLHRRHDPHGLGMPEQQLGAVLGRIDQPTEVLLGVGCLPGSQDLTSGRDGLDIMSIQVLRRGGRGRSGRRPSDLGSV
ncbi:MULTISPECIES: hypothetical protein [unclassified Methylobacterium]|uniref:hypothetical protein n=1 Tax=unclassified Methylobacterium TaxID=2615210 RepID=UPI001FEE6CFE|nr:MULTISPECIES: hypothetical protein [unclassified Methylobacterium]